MKKAIGLIVAIALVLGGVLVWDYIRPKPPVYTSVVGAIALPHCPRCGAKLVPYTDCSECGKRIRWESEEKAKELIDEAGKAIDKTVKDIKE